MGRFKKVCRRTHQSRNNHKTHRAETKQFQNCCPIRLIQLSAVGEVFCALWLCRDTACRVRRFQKGEMPLKTFHRNVFKTSAQQTGNRAERSCSLRPRKAVAFLTHLLRAPKSMGAGNFAVCGQRLRGHAPSKNTSPAALSWSSLIWDSFLKSFCFCAMRLVLLCHGL